MKAMILAAGLGTRLWPLTESKPKALVEIGGRTLLELAIARLRSFGVTEIIVNVHHFGGRVVDYLNSHNNFGARIEISREDDCLLDTGGGLRKASWFFLERGDDEPFLLHNVDVLSTIDLARMMSEHRNNSALATLAVQERKSSRQLLFDDNGLLCGRRKAGEDDEIVRPADPLHPLAFAGIHVISPRLLKLMTEDGVFSIIDTYLGFARAGEKIRAFRADQYYWKDLGRPEDLRQAEQDLLHNVPKY